MAKKDDGEELLNMDDDEEPPEDEMDAIKKALGAAKRRGVKIGPLEDFHDVKHEISRVYRDGRRGKISDLSAQRLSSVLTRLAAVMKISEIEAKLADALQLLEVAKK
jgi:hypothetical protein